MELSIATPSAFRILHANNSPIVKGPFYSVANPWVNLLADRNRKRHAIRRKTWDKAFTAKGINVANHIINILILTRYSTARLRTASCQIYKATNPANRKNQG